MCKAEFLHYLRVREWQDLVGQLRQARAQRRRARSTSTPAAPDESTSALLAGLLSHVGLRDARARREYVGRARRALRALPRLGAGAQAAGVGDGRRARRDVAPVRARRRRRSSRAGSSRSPGTCSSARTPSRAGSASAASVVATERVTLYGLPVVAGAHGGLRRRSTRSCRASCSSATRWSRATGARATLPRRQPRLLEEVEELEHRARRRDIVVDRRGAATTSSTRGSPRVVSGAHFDRWWKDARRARPASCSLHPRAARRRRRDRRRRRCPDAWRQGELELRADLPLRARRAEDDGVTVHVPLHALAQLRADGFDWLVPALREELVTALMRSLPKDLRRPLVPVPETAAEVVAGLRPRRGAAARRGRARDRARARRARRAAPVRPRAAAARTCACASPSRTSAARSLAAGDDLDALREQLRPRLRAQLAAAPRRSSAPACATGRSASCRAGRAARHAARRARLPGAGRRGRRRRRAGVRDAGRAGGGDARRHAARCCASSCPRRCARSSAALPAAPR